MTDSLLSHESTSLTVGEILRRARVQHNLGHEQIAHDLRIRAVYLEALEKGEYDKLPGQAYISGFVRSYAEYLGLDGEKVLGLLKEQVGHKIERPVYVFPVTNDDQKIPHKFVIVIAGLIGFVILLFVQGFYQSSSDPVIPDVPKQLTAQLTPPPKPEAKEVVEEKPVEPAHPVILKAVEDVWLEIRGNDKTPIFSRVLSKGEEYWVPVEQDNATMTTGNAGGLVIVVNGAEIGSLGKSGEVRRGVVLNPAMLKDLKKPEKPAM